MKMHLAAVQIQPILCDRNRNIDKLQHYVELIMKEHVKTDLIIFPELVTSGYECGDEFYNLCEKPGKGPSQDAVKKLAKQFKVNIIFGFPEEDQNIDGILYNSVAVIDRDGLFKGIYRKVHLFAGEKHFFRPGSFYPVFELDIGKVGIMICWDALYPEVARCLAIHGAELLVVCTNWEDPYENEWDFMTSARAFDNTLHLAAANRIGKDKELSFFGHSRILDPLGKEIKTLNDRKEDFIHCEIDTDLTRKLRTEYWTQLLERRIDTYGPLIEEYNSL